MTTSTLTKSEMTTPSWLKIVAGIGVVWYAFGLLQFWLGYSMDTTAAVQSGAITSAHAAAIDGTPTLVWLAFAIASGAGLVGSVLLFSLSSKGKAAFGISLVSAALYYGWVYILSGTGADRPAEELIIAAVVGLVTLAYFLVSFKNT